MSTTDNFQSGQFLNYLVYKYSLVQQNPSWDRAEVRTLKKSDNQRSKKNPTFKNSKINVSKKQTHKTTTAIKYVPIKP